MEHVAKKLGKNPNEVRYINLYQKGQMTPHGQCLSYCNLSSLWIQLLNSAEYEKRQREVAAFNEVAYMCDFLLINSVMWLC